MTETPARAAIVAEALTWEGTPYHPGAKIKGAGVDCAMFPAAVYEAVGLAPEINPVYPPDWMMHHDEELFLEFVLPYASEITEGEARPGDLVIWRFGRTFSHSAIIIKGSRVIHAAIRGHCVFQANMAKDVDLIDRPKRFFTVFGKHVDGR